MTWAWRALKDSVAAGLTVAGDPTPHYLGSKWLAANHQPSRYVWAIRPDAPDKRISKTQTNPPAIYAMRSAMSLHCWGVRSDKTLSDELDYDAAYQLSENVLTALRKECGSDLHIEISGFLDPGRESWIQLGQVYQLNVSLLVPRVGVIEPTQEIEAAGFGIAAQFPAGDYTII